MTDASINYGKLRKIGVASCRAGKANGGRWQEFTVYVSKYRGDFGGKDTAGSIVMTRAAAKELAENLVKMLSSEDCPSDHTFSLPNS